MKFKIVMIHEVCLELQFLESLSTFLSNMVLKTLSLLWRQHKKYFVCPLEKYSTNSVRSVNSLQLSNVLRMCVCVHVK